MTSRNLTLLAVSGLVLALAAPLPAQTMRLAVNIPFEFVAGSRTLPAGDYSVNTASSERVVRVWNENTNEASLVLSDAVSEQTVTTNPEAKLIFRRYGNQYFLARIWTGYGAVGRGIPLGKAERALLAEARSPETLVILAQR